MDDVVEHCVAHYGVETVTVIAIISLLPMLVARVMPVVYCCLRSQ